MSIIGRLAPGALRAAPRAAILFAQIGRQAGRALTEAMEPTLLKPRHVATLDALRDAASTQSALAETAGADAATLVGILNDLEAAGLVSRRRDPADRRRHNVAITQLGLARLAAVDAATEAVTNRFLAGLDTAQRDYLTAILLHVAENAVAEAPCPSSPGTCPETADPNTNGCG